MLYPVVKITFVEKDTLLAKNIKEVLNGGILVHPKNSNYLALLFQYLNLMIITTYYTLYYIYSIIGRFFFL